MASSSQRSRATVEVEMVPGPPRQAPVDQARRAEADVQARASLRLEGLDLDDPAGDAVMDRWVRGELDGDQAIEEMIRLPLS